MRIKRLILTTLLIFELSVPNSAFMATNTQKNSKIINSYCENELMLKLKENEDIKNILSKYGVKLKKSSKKLNLHNITLPSNSNELEIISMLENDPSIESCQLNYQYDFLYTPNDTYFSSQWGLNSIKAPEAWDISLNNEPVTVAILDTGVDSDHEDLIDNLTSGYNIVDNNSDADDDHGHGTHVAGIMGGVIDNTSGISGVSNSIKIMPVKVLDWSGSGYTSDVCDGIIWAVDHGAKIINLSLGGPVLDEFLQNAIDYAYQKDVLVIAAAGNSGSSEVTYPAGADHVIAVSAIDNDLSMASFSNYGSHIDLCAPGVSIKSTIFTGLYGYKSGTSMSCPFISGAASLVWSQNKSLTATEVQNILLNNSIDLGSTGKDIYYGYGLIDLYASVLSAKNTIQENYTPTPTPTSTSFTHTSTPTIPIDSETSLPTETPTPVLPTETPIPPTATSEITPIPTDSTDISPTPTQDILPTSTATPTNKPADKTVIPPNINQPIVPPILESPANTETPTNTPTPSPTYTPVPTNTPTPTIEATETPTSTALSTYTPTPIRIPPEPDNNKQIKIHNSKLISIIVKGIARKPDVPAFIDSSNRTMVPVRFISENLGAKVEWVSKTRTVYIDKDGIKIKISIGSNYIFVNENRIKIDTQAVIKQNRTFLPIRAISNALGENVSWDNETRSVVIS